MLTISKCACTTVVTFCFMILPEHLSSFLVFSRVCVALSLVFCVVFCRSLFVLLPIALFVLLSFTASGCPFGISKLFLSAFSRYTIIFPYGYQIKITIKIHTGTQYSMSILTFFASLWFFLFSFQ
jgi:hypothetical protein